MNKRPAPTLVLSLTVALLLGLLFGGLLPPRQTADAVGIIAVACAHILVTLAAGWLADNRPCLHTLVGVATSGALYWLATVGIALFWRLLRLTDSWLLAAVQLVLAILVLLLWYFFALSDRGRMDEGE